MTCGHTAADPCDKFCPECGADLRETDPNGVKPDDPRWVRFWRSFRSGRNAETYQRLAYHGTTDEDYLQQEVLRWAEDKGPRGYDFRYGWEIVDRPPTDWLQHHLYRLKQHHDGIGEEIRALEALLGGEDGDERGDEGCPESGGRGA